jgi:hypothetical protein
LHFCSKLLLLAFSSAYSTYNFLCIYSVSWNFSETWANYAEVLNRLWLAILFIACKLFSFSSNLSLKLTSASWFLIFLFNSSYIINLSFYSFCFSNSITETWRDISSILDLNLSSSVLHSLIISSICDSLFLAYDSYSYYTIIKG